MLRARLHFSATTWGALLLLLAIFGFGPATLAGGGAESAPYRLGVEVRYGDEIGPTRFIDSLRRELLHELEARACFRSVRAYSEDHEDPDDLLLLVVIHDINDRTEYETTMADRHDDRGLPNEKRPMVIIIEALVDLRLLALPERVVVRSRDFRERARFRPTYREDPRHEVELLVLETLTREARMIACKGAAKKLPREIEKARAGGR
jgi:hypothetical protein